MDLHTCSCHDCYSYHNTVPVTDSEAATNEKKGFAKLYGRKPLIHPQQRSFLWSSIAVWACSSLIPGILIN